jgi:chromosome segregation ATPase
MSEEEKKPEQPKQPEAAPEPNGAVAPEDLATIKAELEEERKAVADAQALLNQRGARIAELEASLTTLSQTTQTAAAELAAARDVSTRAVSKYLEASRALNSTIPGDVIAGATIAEIDASVAKALSIATAVKANLEAQAKEARVPAGAPTRGEISTEGLSPREKIAAGINQKGGT